jgi:hypothetical protein
VAAWNGITSNLHRPWRHAVVRRRDRDAELLTTGSFLTIDLSPLRRVRFDDPARRVTEDLHI